MRGTHPTWLARAGTARVTPPANPPHMAGVNGLRNLHTRVFRKMNSRIYEYKVRRVLDTKGATNIEEMTSIISELSNEGWRLHTVFANEVGKNAFSVGGLGVNSTSDEVVMIFERFRSNLNIARQCPYCKESIDKSATHCRCCGGDVATYDSKLKSQEEELLLESRKALSMKYQSIIDVVNDDKTMEELNYVRRIFGSSMFVDNFNKKARSLGLIDGQLTLNEIEEIIQASRK